MKRERRIFDSGNPASDAANERRPMTRRIPRLKPKQAQRDAEVMKALIYAFDVLRQPVLGLKIFLDSRKRLSDERYWEFLRTVWVLAGKREWYTLFRELFASKRPRRDWFMTIEDARVLDSMPEEFEVYRAAYPEEDDGLSWSLDKGFVVDYAAENGRVILERWVNKRDVFAYISRRGEEEILILTGASS